MSARSKALKPPKAPSNDVVRRRWIAAVARFAAGMQPPDSVGYVMNALRSAYQLGRGDAVERDAARFRWLMERNFGFAFDAERCGISTGRWGRWPEEPDEQRAMIDRAIAAEAEAARDGKGE